MKTTNWILAVTAFVFVVRLSAAAEHTKDTLQVVKARLDTDKAVLVDVREEEEWDDGHLEQAKLMPLSKLQKAIDPQELVKGLDKTTIIYCHCRAGRRALAAAEILQELGYDCRPLKQGYADLLQAGFPKADQ